MQVNASNAKTNEDKNNHEFNIRRFDGRNRTSRKVQVEGEGSGCSCQVTM